MRWTNDPDGTRLPIKIDTATNGEFVPRPLRPHNVAGNAAAMERASFHAKRLGLSRRQFLTSACGAACTLLAFNEVHAGFGLRGGYFEIPDAAAFEPQLASHSLGKREFVFDIQGHHVNPAGRWRQPQSRWVGALRHLPQAGCNALKKNDPLGHLACYTGEVFAKEVFLDSDTDIAVLSYVPTKYDAMPLTIEEAAATRELVNALKGSKRLLLHGRVIPNLPGDLNRMGELAEKWRVAAWKTYTQYGPNLDSGWWLDDEENGRPLIERARALGIRVICVHKGLPLPPPLMGNANRHYMGCRDIGPAARKYPDMSFIVYHSGAVAEVQEGPFVPGSGKDGVDSLLQSLVDNEIPPNSNVYAELGTTWHNLMKDPEQAAHVIGKLLKYVGENNVVWGTDSIWYGSPQDQIQAFRVFQISEKFQETYGYPAITPAIRAKIFGLNAAVPYGINVAEVHRANAGDAVDRARANYANRGDPSFLTYGPKTRREFLRLAAASKHASG